MYQRNVTLYALLPLLFAMALGGCTLADRAVDTSTPSRAILAAYGAAEATANITIALNESGVIPDSRRAEAREILDKAYAAIYAAERALLEGNEDESRTGLEVVNALLLEAQTLVAGGEE